MDTQGDQEQQRTEQAVYRGVMRALGTAAAVIALLVLVGWVVFGVMAADDGVSNIDCSLNGDNC